MDMITFSATWSIYSLNYMDDDHNLSSSTWPPSPQDSSNLEQDVPNTTQELAVNSAAFISTCTTLSIV